jgi:hypothetical protein
VRVRVECYSGGRADERPRALVFAERRLPVAEVLDSWYGEDHLYFKVVIEGGDQYIVRRDEDGLWSVQQFVAAR